MTRRWISHGGTCCLFVSLLCFTICSDAFVFKEISAANGSPSVIALHMAAKTAKNSNKRGGGVAAGGLKGFGTPTIGGSKNNKKSDVEIDRSKLTRDFYEFMIQGNAEDNLVRCTLGSFPICEGVKLRGVVAIKDIKKGEPIIRIPYETAINLGQEGTDPSIPALNFLREYCQTLGTSSRDNNKNRPYFEVLPKFRSEDCLGSTDFFSDEALEALQSPLIVEDTRKRRERTKARFHSDVDDTFPLWIDGTTKVTVEHLQWAVWIITSRVLTVQGSVEEEGKSYKLLIPFLDMCNHDRTSPHILTGRAVPGGELKIVAGSPVKEGEQIVICYGGGMAGNDRFVQEYGFLDTSDNSKAYTMVAQQLLGKRRIVEGIGAGKLLSEMDRERSLKALRSTSLEEDRQLLDDSTLHPQLRAAYRYRLGVKQALSKHIVVA